MKVGPRKSAATRCGVFPFAPFTLLTLLALLALLALAMPSWAHPVIDTRQEACFDARASITCPSPGDDFYGQDAQYLTTQPVYSIGRGGEVVIDHATELVWTRGPDANGDGQINAADKMTWAKAVDYADTLNARGYGGYHDWRLPSIRELYSLMDCRGTDISAFSPAGVPCIDADYFDFSYGDTAAGDREIDMQYLSATLYTGTVMEGSECAFGLNVADGRIKCYPTAAAKYALYVRGNPEYGASDFWDNGDGTVSDRATGLMWQQADSGYGMIWEDALGYCQHSSRGGHDDWRLPDAKELQSIVDYGRSPEATGSPALDPVFQSSVITNEAGQADWPFYWTGTTHQNNTAGGVVGDAGVYIAFGRALGYFAPHGSQAGWMDVHGAGAQRADPKAGDPGGYPAGRGPQGDAVRIYNYVRCVRGGL
jgi:hypothetical protein